MRIGYGITEITPRGKLTLAGFASRLNQPMKGVFDSIFVKSLFAEQGGQPILVMDYDLLGIGAEQLECIQKRLDKEINTPRKNRIFICTHTHSAPAAITTIGCGIISDDYVKFLADCTAESVLMAISNASEARYQYGELNVPGLSRNRRNLLSDGRVVMVPAPSDNIIKAGPVCDTFKFVRFVDINGNPIVGLINWAAHACVNAEHYVSADYPGELCSLLEEQHGFPFMFIQGGAGNINLFFHLMNREEMLKNANRIFEQIKVIPYGEQNEVRRFILSSPEVRLDFKNITNEKELKCFKNGMVEIAETGNGKETFIKELANILNVPPGKTPDNKMLRYIARTQVDWCDYLATARFKKNIKVPLSLWAFDDILFCFIGGEIFYETVMRIEKSATLLEVVTAGYASPQLGYILPEEAVAEGGYEAAFAYRFYGYPSVFEGSSEDRIVEAICKEINKMNK